MPQHLTPYMCDTFNITMPLTCYVMHSPSIEFKWPEVYEAQSPQWYRLAWPFSSQVGCSKLHCSNTTMNYTVFYTIPRTLSCQCSMIVVVWNSTKCGWLIRLISCTFTYKIKGTLNPNSSYLAWNDQNVPREYNYNFPL